jgi:hypothetical protein
VTLVTQTKLDFEKRFPNEAVNLIYSAKQIKEKIER